MVAAWRGGKATPLGHKETVGRYAECGVMMKTAPAAAFEVSQSEFLFQFFIIAFDDPALFGPGDQVAQSAVFRQIRQPVFARFGLAAGPLDEQPLRHARLGKLVVAMCRANAYGSE